MHEQAMRRAHVVPGSEPPVRRRAPWGAVSSWWTLVALCVGTNILETALVMGFDHGARPDLAPQASAVAPFGVFGDLRWVSVYHNSWAGFAAEIAAMVVVRGALIALSVGLAWSATRECPRPRTLLTWGMLSTALAALLLAPSVALLFGMAAVPVSWLFLAAVPAALLVALIVHPVAVSGDWWRRPVALRALGWVALAFVGMSAATASMSALPAPAWPVVCALSGLFNAWCWVGLVRAVVDRPPARHVVPLVPAALAALVGVVIGGTVLGFTRAHPTRSALGPLTPIERTTGPPVLVVFGYGSTWDGQAKHPIPGTFSEQEFSYRGLDAHGRPLPYSSADTVKSLPELEHMLLAQIALVHHRTGQEVDVVAESEGALVAKTALLAQPRAHVGAMVLASPLQAPGRVSYPTGGTEGWGTASNAGMRLLGGAFQGVSPIALSPDSPFLASLDRMAPYVGKAMSCPVPGVEQFALLPLADATVTPADERLRFPSVVVPAFHGGMLSSTSNTRIVARVLAHRSVGEDPLLRFAYKTITSAAGAWQVPSLVPSDYPTGTEPNTISPTCPQVAAALRDTLG